MSVFEVAVGPGRGPGLVRVEVVRSDAGEASAEAALDAGGLAAGRAAFEQTLLVSSVATRDLSREERVVRDAGQALFAGLLGAEPVAGRYRASVALAARRDEALQIVLRIDAPELAGLPWEAMYDAGAGGYVCREHDLVRHVPVPAVPPPLEVGLPLRVLGVISAPRGLAPLDTARERAQLERALSGLAGTGRAEVAWAEPTWAGLHEMLLAGPWHVLHFIGHGDFDARRDEGVLALTGEDGHADLIEASRLTTLLRQARPMPRLVVLNSCSGAAAAAGDLFSGTAAALARSGVAAVAAMQFAVSDPAAVAFARGFYAALARGRGVDQAVSAGRVAILGTGARTLEWVTPALYLRGHDTRLFTITAAACEREPDPAPRPYPARQAPGPGRQPGPRPEIAADRPQASNEAKPPAREPSRTVRIFAGHIGCVFGVAFSPDSTRLATAGQDATARVWHTNSGTPAATLSGHTGPVTEVAFSPDGALLATAGLITTARLWDTNTGTPAATLTGPGGVTDLAFSPDGALLATASEDMTAWLWDTTNGTPIRTFSGHSGAVRGVAFSPDGAFLATVSDDCKVRLWHTDTGACAATLTGHINNVRGVAYSPDGAFLATVGDDRAARLWHTDTGACAATLTGHAGPVLGVAFSPDGTLLATASADGTARLWA